MQKNFINAEKIPLMQKNSRKNSKNAEKISLMQKNSINAEKFQKFPKM
jgi:hypothetical protein